MIETGEKPSHFASAVPSERSWKSYLSTKKTKNAIRVARTMAAEVDRFQSVSAAAHNIGLSRTMVHYHLALLKKLPSDFVEWLEGEEDQRMWAFFSERTLRPITKLNDEDEKVRQLSQMIANAEEAIESATIEN